MSRFHTGSPSLFERIFSGLLFAGAVALGLWWWRAGGRGGSAMIDPLVHRGLLVAAFLLGFGLGVSRTADLIFRGFFRTGTQEPTLWRFAALGALFVAAWFVVSWL